MTNLSSTPSQQENDYPPLADKQAGGFNAPPLPIPALFHYDSNQREPPSPSSSSSSSVTSSDAGGVVSDSRAPSKRIAGFCSSLHSSGSLDVDVDVDYTGLASSNSEGESMQEAYLPCKSATMAESEVILEEEHELGEQYRRLSPSPTTEKMAELEALLPISSSVSSATARTAAAVLMNQLITYLLAIVMSACNIFNWVGKNVTYQPEYEQEMIDEGSDDDKDRVNLTLQEEENTAEYTPEDKPQVGVAGKDESNPEVTAYDPDQIDPEIDDDQEEGESSGDDEFRGGRHFT